MNEVKRYILLVDDEAKDFAVLTEKEARDKNHAFALNLVNKKYVLVDKVYTNKDSERRK